MRQVTEHSRENQGTNDVQQGEQVFGRFRADAHNNWTIDLPVDGIQSLHGLFVRCWWSAAGRRFCRRYQRVHENVSD